MACNCCSQCECRSACPKVQVGQKAPPFECAAVMPDGSTKTVKLDDYKGKTVLLFFYPFDFTFVCPSEIIAFHKSVKEFEARNTVILGCSIDSTFVHSAWRGTDLNNGGIGKIDFPLLADVTRKVCSDYGVLLDEGMALRGLFLIDKNQIIQHYLVNNLPLGRSVDEAIRIVDAMTFVQTHGAEVCPANWKKGAKTMKPTAAGVAEYLAHNA